MTPTRSPSERSEKPELLNFSPGKQKHRNLVQARIYNPKLEINLEEINDYMKKRWARKLMEQWNKLGPIDLCGINYSQKGRFDRWKPIKYE